MLVEFLLLVILHLALPSARSEGADPQSFAGKNSMSGYHLSDFSGFEKDWRLVTVRYRKDTGEMRWTFANDLAWKTLSSGSIDYPKGATFAKIGIVTTPDSQFPSSSVPSGARRYQFMIRDQEKHGKTGGWGYALFDLSGKTFPEDPKVTVQACWACHRIVENRGQVFSQPFQLAPYVKTAFLSSGKGFRTLTFSWMNTEKTSKALREHLPAGTARIRILDEPGLRRDLFQGTLDEIRPSLEIEAYQSGSPAALLSLDGTRFSIVFPVKKEDCPAGRSFRAITTLPSRESKPIEREYCNP